MLSHHPHYLFSIFVLSPERESWYPLRKVSSFPSPLCLYEFAYFLDISYNWNHILFALMRMTYFAKHNVFKMYPCFSIYQNFISFFGIISIYHFWHSIISIYHILFVPSSVVGRLGCSHCGFYTYLMSTDVEHLFCDYWPFVQHLWKLFIQISFPLFNWIICFLIIEFQMFFMYSGSSLLSDTQLANICSHSVACFYFLESILWSIHIFNFDEVQLTCLFVCLFLD